MTEQDWLTSTDPHAMLATITNRPERVPPSRPPVLASDRKLRLFACAVRDCQNMTVDPYPSWAAFAREIVEEGIIWRNGSASGTHEPEAVAALLREVFGNPFRPVRIAHDRWNAEQAGQRGDCWLWSGWLTTTVLSLAQAAYEERGRTCPKCGGRGQVIQQWRIAEMDADEHGTSISPCPDCHAIGTVGAGTLETATLAVLADALEEAGCTLEAMLRHLRGQERCLCQGGHLVPKYGTRWERTRTCGTCSGTGWRQLSGPHVRSCWALELILGTK